MLYFNRAARAGLELGPSATLAGLAALLGEGLSTQFRDVIMPAALRDGLWRGEVVARTPAAAEHPYSLIVLAHGEPECSFLSVIARDLQGVRRLEEQARQSQKMEAIGRLAGGIAHDFNNLLSVILGYLDLARAELPAGAALDGLLAESRQAAERAADLTRQRWRSAASRCCRRASSTWAPCCAACSRW